MSKGSRLTVDRAVALEHRDPESLPTVLLSGEGGFAKLIVSLAQKSGVPVEENSELADLLAGLDAGAEIPPESFRLVAEILAFLYEMDQQWGEEQARA